MYLFASDQYKTKGKALADRLGLPFMGISCVHYPSGEQQAYAPGLDALLSAKALASKQEDQLNSALLFCPLSPPFHDALFTVFHMLNLLNKAGVRKKTLFVPYLPYLRQDRATVEQSNGVQLLAGLLGHFTLEKLITLDPHSSIHTLFSCEIEVLSPLSLFQKKAEKLIADGPSVHENWLVVSPDEGSCKRAQTFARLLKLSFVCMKKKRDAQGSNISIVEAAENFTGKTILLIDDMIDSGQTVLLAAQCLREKGAKQVHAFVTHGVFSQPFPENALESLTLTDSLPSVHASPFCVLPTLDLYTSFLR